MMRSKIVILLIFLVLLVSCGKNKKSTIIYKFSIVDSVKIVRPGEINTLQFDYLYKIRNKDSYEFISRCRLKKGDTVHYIYRQYRD